MRLAALFVLDDLAEGHGTLHGLAIAHQVVVQPLLGQGFPAANYLGGIVHAQLVVLAFEQVLNAAADVAFFNGQYHYLVVA